MTAAFEFEIGAQPAAADSAFEDFWTNFRSEMNSSNSNSTTRTALRTMLSEKYGSGFEAMDLMHSTAEEAVNWASETVHGALDETPEDDAFAEYAITTSQMVNVVEASTLPRNTSYGRHNETPDRVVPDESVPTSSLTEGADEIAALQVDALIRAFNA